VKLSCRVWCWCENAEWLF